MIDVPPGLEGVIAFETTIAEPDRDGGALRYRGVDIEDLAGVVDFGAVWGLLVDDAPRPGLTPGVRAVDTATTTGQPIADLQAATARLSGALNLRPLLDLTGEEAREDLRRVSSAMFAITAQLARQGDGLTVPAPSAPADVTMAERFVWDWRAEFVPSHARALDAYWICIAEHGLNASTFVARIAASTGADCAMTLAAAVGALSGPLHGGAPARVLPMLDAAAGAGDLTAHIRRLLDSGERLMGFGHRVYRAEDPRSRVLRRTAEALDAPRYRIAAAFEAAALDELRRRKPDRVLATNVEFWSAVLLDAAGVPAPLAPALFACSRTAGWSAHVLEQHATGRLIRPSARYIGPSARRWELTEPAAATYPAAGPPGTHMTSPPPPAALAPRARMKSRSERRFR